MSGVNDVSNPCEARVPEMCRNPEVETQSVTVNNGSRALTYITASMTQDDGTTVVEEVIKRGEDVVVHKQHIEAETGERITKVRREPQDMRCS